jgi:hypothetical protein
VTAASVPAAVLAQAFFVEYLLNQKHASPRTLAAYRDAFAYSCDLFMRPNVSSRQSSMSRISMRQSFLPSSTMSNSSEPTVSAREMPGWQPYVLFFDSSKCGSQRLWQLPPACLPSRSNVPSAS